MQTPFVAVWIGKEFHANFTLDRPSHYAMQVGPPRHFLRSDRNLRDESGCVGNRGPEDQPVKA